MAARFWVGGTGTWDASTTTNWSATTGGAGGASAPTSADTATFDANSGVAGGGYAVTINTGAACSDWSVVRPGAATNITINGTQAMTVAGSVSWGTAGITRAYIGTITFTATTSQTVNFGGVALSNALTFNGVGGTWTLGAALTTTASNIQLTAGTLDTAGFAVSCSSLNSSVTTNARTLTLGASVITLTGSVGMPAAADANLTINAGTSKITLTGGAPTVTLGGKTFYDLELTATSFNGSTFASTAAATLNSLRINSKTSLGVAAITFSSSLTINGNLTLAGGSGASRVMILSDVIGTARTLTVGGTVSLSDVDFRDITAAGAATRPWTGTRLGDGGGNSQITFAAAKTVYWNLAAGGNWESVNWATSSGGATSAANFPLPQDTAIVGDTGLNTGATITLSSGGAYLPTLDSSTRTLAWTFGISLNIDIYGSVSLSSAFSSPASFPWVFSGRGTQVLTSAGLTLNWPITVNAPSGTVQLSGALTLGSTRAITLTNGTLDLNGYNLTAGLFSSTNSNVRAFAFGSGTMTLTFTSGTVFTTAVATNLTVTPGTGKISMTAAAGKNFAGGGKNWPVLENAGAGVITVTGANTFADMQATTGSAGFILPASITTTVNAFSLSGTAGNVITLRSSSAGTRATLSKPSGTVTVSYLDIKDSAATGGATWRADTSAGAVDSLNNTGWTFGSFSGGGGGATALDELFTGALF